MQVLRQRETVCLVLILAATIATPFAVPSARGSEGAPADTTSAPGSSWLWLPVAFYTPETNLAGGAAVLRILRSAEDTTVSFDPRDSQYSLEVITFDGEKRVPIKVMSYKDTLNNLLKMRRESGHVQVGGRWLPTEITIENFPLKATSTITLQWTTVVDQASRFDPATFATVPSLLAP